jgi:mRNA interferase RelE/StbE
VGAATQIYYSAFDTAFLKLPKALHDRIEAKLDNMGRQLDQFPHHRLVGSQRFRLRVGDYRIIYTFDVSANELHLLSVGHRREIYR